MAQVTPRRAATGYGAEVRRHPTAWGTPLLTVLTLVGVLLWSPPAPAARPGAEPARATGADPDVRVLAISLDGLNPTALTKLGRARLPHLWRLIDEGASTLNARTQVELTITLPNHTSMVTGRRIDAARGGHGVTWNTDEPGTTVQKAAGHPVGSVFSALHDAGLSTALFASKTKFSLFQRSWPAGIDKVVIKEEQDAALAKGVRSDLLTRDRDFTFLHLGGADKTGHARRWMSKPYLDAVRKLDGLVGLILRAHDTHDSLDDLVIVLTADHGGKPGTKKHDDRTLLANYRIPFVVWGAGVADADLYALNPGYQAPGRGRPGLTGRQPVRNGNVANLAADLLGVAPVAGSLFGAQTPLRVS